MASMRRFTMNFGRLPEGHVFRGQAKVIVDYLRENPGQTVGEMTKGIGVFEGSRQDPERVIGFYMTVWKKKGWVRVTEAPPVDLETAVNTAPAAGVPSREPQTEDEDIDLDEDEDEEDEDVDDEDLEDVNGGKTIEERLTPDERVQFEEEMSAASPDEHGGKFDGLKMTEAIAAVLVIKNGISKDEILQYLNDNDYAATKQQVQGALTSLVRQGVVKMNEQGQYDLLTQTTR